MPACLGRVRFALDSLLKKFPPHWVDKNKKTLAALVTPPTYVPSGTLTVSRWALAPLPTTLASSTPTITLREGVFSYENSKEDSTAWHVNFANAEVFCAYGARAFAQDEHQVAEHPALASVREALLQSNEVLPLVREANVSTPMLFQGVPRLANIATDPDIEEYRPYGLYGQAFFRAEPRALQRAVTCISPPTISNIIAIEAPIGGVGRYTRATITDALQTAYTSFLCARNETTTPSLTLHTGHWGAGVYGGDRTLMALVQFLAAHMAGVNAVVYYTFDRDGTRAVQDAQKRFARLLSLPTTEAALDAIIAMNFQWGTGDGN